LLFTVDGFAHIIERLVVDQSMTAILTGETFPYPVLVLKHAPTKVVCHSDVNHARFAGDDVDTVAMLSHTDRKQVPRLRIAIDSANRNATLGMTGLGGN
jgi:hypothetical protein